MKPTDEQILKEMGVQDLIRIGELEHELKIRNEHWNLIGLKLDKIGGVEHD